jgi:hypothetical protein
MSPKRLFAKIYKKEKKRKEKKITEQNRTKRRSVSGGTS